MIWLDPSVDVQVEGSTLAIRIPMRFQRRCGRKRIVAPDGSALVPATQPQPDGALEGAGAVVAMAAGAGKRSGRNAGRTRQSRADRPRLPLVTSKAHARRTGHRGGHLVWQARV
jgi:hypothetical protein